MKYIGNKFRLLPFIDKAITQGKLPTKGTFCDIFSGTTNVAQFYKKKGYKLITCDIMYYSYVFQHAYIKNNSYPSFSTLLQREENIIKARKQIQSSTLFNDDANKDNLKAVLHYLNNLPGEESFIYLNYAPGGSRHSEYQRQYFRDENAKRVDAIRNRIQLWKDNNWLTENEFFVLLAPLIDAADFVANISGTYGAFLKIWRSMALKHLTLLTPKLTESDLKHEIYLGDANKLIRNIKCDILYLDPPYNSRQYAPNFHILETIARWDNPKIYGKTGLRPYDGQKSDYNVKGKCEKKFADLVKNADCKYILLSYNNEGIIKDKTIKDVLSEKGDLKIFTQPYRRFRTDSESENRHYKVANDIVTENLYLVKVKN
ncbi:DNA adenine methylase [Candidatus Oleimmundimicrobium sp.]|uniref:DNA adenine methylase n=1 Tax=Candidatus Oleimmundimicrobium sp. TaxID=3060597 RepID=UPI00271A7176|nr:DNA adenine methylase [Candidatus Oleimmundimicrobium sp.]MDO8886807.1 DNA adenine methylase [Candidatus Oleimmundimicrobium sp.]